MKFGQIMDVDDPKVDPEGQGQRSRSVGQKRDLRPYLICLQVLLEVKDHLGQGQRSHWSRSKVTWIKMNLKVKAIRSKCNSMSHLTGLQVILEVKGQRTCGSRSASRSLYRQVGSRQRQVAFFFNFDGSMVTFADDVKVNTSKRYLYLMTNSDITCKRSHVQLDQKK